MVGIPFKAISKNALGEIQIKKISIEEQRVCIHIIDKVVKIIAIRKQQLQELDTLIRARFVEMFGDP